MLTQLLRSSILRRFCRIILILIIVVFVFFNMQDLAGLKYEGKKIKAIIVKGIINTDEDVVYDALTFKEGIKFDPGELSQSIKNIYKTAKYSDVKVDIVEKNNQLVITIIVEERLIIKEIAFKGNDEFGDTDLNEAIQDYVKEENVLDEYKVNEAVAIILSKYNEEGFNDATIRTFKIVNQKEKTCKLIFKIKEGDEVRVARINITGNKVYEDKKIIRKMETHIDDWLHSGIFNQDEYEQDKEKIVRFYRNHGYIKAAILKDQLKYRIEGDKRAKEKRLYIVIKLAEGKQYKFGRYSLSGYTLFTEDELKDLLKLETGKIFNQDTFERDIMRIQQLYSERGYIFARIVPEEKIDEEINVVSYHVSITEGEIAHIENIILKGNTKTKDYVVLRELLVQEGELFNARKIRRSQEKIYNMGFFKIVNLDVRPGSALGLMNLIIEVEEQMTGLITLGIMYGTIDKLGGYEEISENNLFGRGIRIHEKIEWQEKRENYEIGMSLPWIFGTPTTFSFSLFFRKKKELPPVESVPVLVGTNWVKNDVTYDRQEVGGTVGLSRRLTDTDTVSAFYGIEVFHYYWFRPKGDGFIREPGDAHLRKYWKGRSKIKSSLTLRYDYDSRDNIFNPTRGLHFNQSWTIVGGLLMGDDEYMKYITDVSRYYPLFWKFVLVLHGNLGLIGHSFAGKLDITSDDFLYLGGVESIRGYGYWDPQWRGGGKSRLYSNVEYRFPIAEQILWAVMFVDGGHLWRELYLVNLNYKEYWFSAGWGFRVQIPMIPIRLYFSKRFDYDERKEEWMLRNKTIGNWEFDFSVGGLF